MDVKEDGMGDAEKVRMREQKLEREGRLTKQYQWTEREGERERDCRLESK